MSRLEESEREFLFRRFGLREAEVREAAEITRQSPLRSAIRRNGAVVKAALINETQLSRRNLIAGALALGSVLPLAQLGLSTIPEAEEDAGAIIPSITGRVAQELEALLKKSVNNSAALADMRSYSVRAKDFCARDVLDRLLRYRLGEVFDASTTTAFWDSRISDQYPSLAVFRDLFKSREFLRVGDAEKARNALSLVAQHNANSVTQTLNIEIMTSLTLKHLLCNQRTDVALQRIGEYIGQIWHASISDVLDLVRSMAQWLLSCSISPSLLRL